jgi:hypothetical protein
MLLLLLLLFARAHFYLSSGLAPGLNCPADEISGAAHPLTTTKCWMDDGSDRATRTTDRPTVRHHRCSPFSQQQ